MLKRSSIFYLSRFSIFSAVLYCIPVVFFLKEEKFSDTWLLYLGNALFLVCIFIFGVIYGKKKSGEIKSYNGLAITIIAIIFSCILILLLTLVLAPDVYNIGASKETLQQTPAAITAKNQHGLLFMMLADAIIVNFAAGAFATLMAKSIYRIAGPPS